MKREGACVPWQMYVHQRKMRQRVDSFYHVGSGNQIQLVRPGRKQFYPLSYFTDLQVEILRILFSKATVSL